MEADITVQLRRSQNEHLKTHLDCDGDTSWSYQYPTQNNELDYAGHPQPSLSSIVPLPFY